MIQLIALTYSKVSTYLQGCEIKEKFDMNFGFKFSPSAGMGKSYLFYFRFKPLSV